MPLSGTPSSENPLDHFAASIGAAWPNIDASGREAAEKRAKIDQALQERRLDPTDTALVVYGSIARGEWTSGSDVDWTLLVDGEADEGHQTIASSIRDCLQDLGHKDPGRTAVFGGLTFSHELVHRIGGEYDSNRNTTQRILLLLESRSLADADLVRDRVIKVLFSRYVEDDKGYHVSEGGKLRVPRFLLNDVVRYWRTMAVDFAAKRRERSGEGWALRNIKLRMSRKLIFVAGLGACLCCRLRPSTALQAAAMQTEDDFHSALIQFLFDYANQTPLEVLADLSYRFNAGTAGKVALDAYDEFLGILRDSDKRTYLEKLDLDAALTDSLFATAKELATRFQEGLMKLFFHSNPDLTEATQRYGVF